MMKSLLTRINPGNGITTRELLAMSWIIRLEVRRIVIAPWLRLRFFLNGVRWGRSWRIYGMPIIQRYRGSTLRCGDGLSLRSWVTSNPLSPNHPVVLSTRAADAKLMLGNDVGITGGSIVAVESITIGDRVFIGANTVITDTDFHPLDPDERRIDVLAGSHRPVVIENDVFVGMNSIILKGVHIGEGAVIGAGSVVTRDVPARSIAAGNPAKVLGSVQ